MTGRGKGTLIVINVSRLGLRAALIRLTTKFDMETNVNNTTEPKHTAQLPVARSVCPKCKGQGWYFVNEWIGTLQGRKDCKCKGRLTHNVRVLGEEADLKAESFSLAQMPNRKHRCSI
jgi:hypothetical protein